MVPITVCAADVGALIKPTDNAIRAIMERVVIGNLYWIGSPESQEMKTEQFVNVRIRRIVRKNYIDIWVCGSAHNSFFPIDSRFLIGLSTKTRDMGLHLQSVDVEDPTSPASLWRGTDVNWNACETAE